MRVAARNSIAGLSRERALRLALFAAWLITVLFLVEHHVFRRDEVRALSFALYGDSIGDMLANMQRDGHPALWHLILRGTFAIFADVRVLPVVSVIFATAAALLLVFRSPFGLAMIAAILFSVFFVYEYSVVARNYGISMLLMFAIAALYPRYRDNGIILGVLLLLLANTNVHSAVLAGAFVLFWFVDLIIADRIKWSPALRNFLINAAIATAGAAACAATIYSPFEGAKMLVRDHADNNTRMLVQAVVQPASRFFGLAHDTLFAGLIGQKSGDTAAVRWLMSLVMFGSLLGLRRRPAALVAALFALLALALLFTKIYPGFYRHQTLWLVFLIVMYWITLAGARGSTAATPLRRTIDRAGYAMFAVLIALQLPSGVAAITAAITGPPPSRVRDLAALVAAHPGLREATILGDPDYLIEPVRYYMPNPTYLVREQRYGPIANFIRPKIQDLTLNHLLAIARCRVVATGKPVVILLQARLDPALPPRTIKEGYTWTLSTSPDQVRRFVAATHKLASFAPVRPDSPEESYDVYRLDAPQPCAG